jgi:hypothetical protein
MRVVRSYHHHDGSIGVVCTFTCGSDFTARTPEFRKLCDEVLQSIAFWGRSLDRRMAQAGKHTIKGLLGPDWDRGSIEWVGDGGHATIGDALKAAKSLFKETIELSSYSIQFGDDDGDFSSRDESY